MKHSGFCLVKQVLTNPFKTMEQPQRFIFASNMLSVSIARDGEISMIGSGDKIQFPQTARPALGINNNY